MSEPIDHVSTTDHLEAATRDFGSRLWTELVCRFVSYDATTQKATVRPVSKLADRALPDIPNRPVLWPSGGTGSIHFPVAAAPLAGDPCVLHVLTLPVDEYLTGANTEEQITTQRGQAWRFDLSNSYVSPGGPRAFSSPLPPDAVDAVATVLRGVLVKLGDSTADDFVALSSLVIDRFDELKTWIVDVLSPAIIAGSAVTPPAAWIPVVPSVAATKVQAK